MREWSIIAILIIIPATPIPIYSLRLAPVRKMGSQRSRIRLSQACDRWKQHETLVMLGIEHRFLAGWNPYPFEIGSKYGSPETWMSERHILLPSSRMFKIVQHSKIVPQILNRSCTEPRIRFRGFTCHGQNTSYVPILGDDHQSNFIGIDIPIQWHGMSWPCTIAHKSQYD